MIISRSLGAISLSLLVTFILAAAPMERAPVVSAALAAPSLQGAAA